MKMVDKEKDVFEQQKVIEGENPKMLEHAIDADEAMKAYSDHEGGIVALDESTNKRLLRKIDMNILPVWLPRISWEFIMPNN